VSWDPWGKAHHPERRAPETVWTFLIDSSTDNLDRLARRDRDARYKRAIGVSEPTQPKRRTRAGGRPISRDDATFDWNPLDLRLAREFAARWDETGVFVRGFRSYSARRDVDAVGRQIEQWGLQSLLLTERARRMYRYRLPNLTCLYRCSTQIGNLFIRASYLSPANMVAGIDLDRSLERLGFTYDERRTIDTWLLAHSYPHAEDALDAVKRLGLRYPMSEDERRATIAVTANVWRKPALRDDLR
jgi:hypothetical protein